MSKRRRAPMTRRDFENSLEERVAEAADNLQAELREELELRIEERLSEEFEWGLWEQVAQLADQEQGAERADLEEKIRAQLRSEFEASLIKNTSGKQGVGS